MYAEHHPQPERGRDRTVTDLDLDAIRARWKLFEVAERDLGLGTRRVQDYLYRSDMPNLLAALEQANARIEELETQR